MFGRRLNQLQGHANETMDLAQAVLQDFRDGFYVEVEIKGKKLPVRLRIIADEEAAQMTGEDDPTLDIIISKLAALLGK